MFLFRLNSCLGLISSDLSNFKFVQQTSNPSAWIAIWQKITKVYFYTLRLV